MAERDMILGHLGRDHVLAERLAEEGRQVHGIGAWLNPGLIDVIHRSGGTYYHLDELSGTPDVVNTIADIVAEAKPDTFVTNSDEMLAAGVVDVVRARTGQQLLIPSPDKAAARIEWDKFALRELIETVAPGHNPRHERLTQPEEITAVVDRFARDDIPVVVKPRGLTGGVGVKVMGPHLDTYQAAKAYAAQVLAMPGQTGVEIQEKLTGPEFTLQIFTDGKTMIRPPATYDYPYREDGDTGPGTGGVGTFSMSSGLLPFLTAAEYNEAFSLSEQLLQAWQAAGNNFKGLWYGSFFKTADGLKMTEVNARGGDPEFINIVDLLEDDVSLGGALESIATGHLRPDAIRFKKLASTVVHLVPPEYRYQETAPATMFTMDEAAMRAAGCRVRFAAAEHAAGQNKYRLPRVAKALGLSALATTPWEAREIIHHAIDRHCGQPLPLVYRRDVGDRGYIQALSSS